MHKVENALKILNKNQKSVNILLLPEYSLPTENSDCHKSVIAELQEIATERKLLIIGGDLCK